ncbi:hypothetical protein SH139x_005740 [Planctomycetaceae bacterium SH139]
MSQRHLIAKYVPPKTTSLLFNFVGAVLLATAAFGLLRFLMKGNFVGAQWMFYPILLAVALAISSIFDLLRRAPVVTLYDNGVKIGGGFMSWSAIDEVRYRRYESRFKRIKHEWNISANGKQHCFSMLEPHTHIDRKELNSAFVGNVKKFRDSSRII